mgnify:CR=1 FL=1
MVNEVLRNISLIVICYGYIALVISISSKIGPLLHVSRKTSRKFLHIMIGNLMFIIPFFTSSIYPTLVAAPFILVTLIASPFSPIKAFSVRLKGLLDITEQGHSLGLFFYAVSYTILAFFFASETYMHILAAGIMPMAYGDAFASIVGEKYGRRRLDSIARKSVEGTVAMFFFSLVSLSIIFSFFSLFNPLLFPNKIYALIIVALVAAIVEIISPLGFDNLTVPICCALMMLLIEQ